MMQLNQETIGSVLFVPFTDWAVVSFLTNLILDPDPMGGGGDTGDASYGAAPGIKSAVCAVKDEQVNVCQITIIRGSSRGPKVDW